MGSTYVSDLSAYLHFPFDSNHNYPFENNEIDHLDEKFMFLHYRACLTWISQIWIFENGNPIELSDSKLVFGINSPSHSFDKD